MTTKANKKEEKKSIVSSKKTTVEIKRIELFNKKNIYLIILGILFIVLGYILMSGGKSTNPNFFNEEKLFSFTRTGLSTIFILFGYAIIIVGILFNFKK